MTVINVKSGKWLKLRTYFGATQYSTLPTPTSILFLPLTLHNHELGQVVYRTDRRHLAGRLIGDLPVAMPLPTRDIASQKKL